MPVPPPFVEILLVRREPAPSLPLVVASAAGVTGFIGLLLAAAYVGAFEELLIAAALIWFLGFGVAGVVLDLRRSRALRGRKPASRGGGRWTGVGLA